MPGYIRLPECLGSLSQMVDDLRLRSSMTRVRQETDRAFENDSLAPLQVDWAGLDEAEKSDSAG